MKYKKLDYGNGQCPECRSTRLKKSGFGYLGKGVRAQRYQCLECGRTTLKPVRQLELIQNICQG